MLYISNATFENNHYTNTGQNPFYRLSVVAPIAISTGEKEGIFPEFLQNFINYPDVIIS